MPPRGPITRRPKRLPKANLIKYMLNFLKKKIRQALASWRTTATGVASVLTGAGMLINAFMSDGDADSALIGSAWAAIMLGIGQIAGKDNLTKSEDIPK